LKDFNESMLTRFQRKRTIGFNEPGGPMLSTITHLEPGLARIGAAPGPRLLVTPTGVLLISRANLGGRPIRDLEAAARQWPDMAAALRTAADVQASLDGPTGRVTARDALR
jgi:hypothetical protein